jgi:hypothetical protein
MNIKRSAGMTSLFIVLFSITMTGYAQNISQPNFVGVELLGRAGIYSANYERSLNSRIALGSGLAYWHLDGNTFIAPMYVSATPIGTTHSLYLATGVTFGLSNENLLGSPTNYRGGKFGTVTGGYQFRSREGLIIRPTANFVYGSWGHIIWPGVTIGHTF